MLGMQRPPLQKLIAVDGCRCVLGTRRAYPGTKIHVILVRTGGHYRWQSHTAQGCASVGMTGVMNNLDNLLCHKITELVSID